MASVVAVSCPGASAAALRGSRAAAGGGLRAIGLATAARQAPSSSPGGARMRMAAGRRGAWSTPSPRWAAGPPTLLARASSSGAAPTADAGAVWEAAVSGHEGEWYGQWRAISGRGQKLEEKRQVVTISRGKDKTLDVEVKAVGEDGVVGDVVASQAVDFNQVPLSSGFAGPMFAQAGLAPSGMVAVEAAIRHRDFRFRVIVAYLPPAEGDAGAPPALSKVTVVREALGEAAGGDERELFGQVGFDDWMGGWAGDNFSWDERGMKSRPVKWWVDGAESKGGFGAPLNSFQPCTLSTPEVQMESIRLPGGVVLAVPRALASGAAAHKVVINWLPTAKDMYRAQVYFTPKPGGEAPPPGFLPVEFSVDALKKTG